MTFLVTLKSGAQFAVDGGQTILAAARAAGVVLDYSCRTGRCGVCRATVLSGETEARLAETWVGEGRDANEILTCCRTPASDLLLEAEDLSQLADIEIRTVPARIDGIEQVGPGVVKVRLRLPPTARFRYIAGQYVDIIAHGVRRSYSLATAPQVDGRLEMHIAEVPGGTLSSYWFGNAAVNDLIRLEGPLGTFFLRDSGPETAIVFLATGTGIAPVLAMVQDMAQHRPADLARTTLLWGNRHTADFYLDPAIFAAVRYIPVVSRPDGEWQGAIGHVQDNLSSSAFDPERTMVYACGSPAMIDSARTRLVREMGLASSQFLYDSFVPSTSVAVA